MDNSQKKPCIVTGNLTDNFYKGIPIEKVILKKARSERDRINKLLKSKLGEPLTLQETIEMFVDALTNTSNDVIDSIEKERLAVLADDDEDEVNV